MQTLMVDDVLDHVPRDLRSVEDTADDNRVMRRVEVSEHGAGALLAPGHLRASEQAVEEARVEVVEDGLEIVDMSLRAGDALASARLADEVDLALQVVAADVSAIARGVVRLDGLAVELGEQNVRDRAQHRFRRAFQ